MYKIIFSYNVFFTYVSICVYTRLQLNLFLIIGNCQKPLKVNRELLCINISIKVKYLTLDSCLQFIYIVHFPHKEFNTLAQYLKF